MDDVLIHHGILGQKWGIRRFQNPDGTLTDAGKKRLAAKEKRDAETDAYARALSRVNKKTVEQNKAELEAEREKLKRAAMIAGGVALAAGATYAYVKLKPAIEANRDQVIKSGSSIFRTAAGDTEYLHDVFYATPDSHDAAVYKALWGGGNEPGVGYKYAKEYTAKSDIKIAGMKTAEKEFKDMLKNDPDFAKKVKELNTMAMLYGQNVNTYKGFNTLAPLEKDDTGAFAAFQAHMQKKGYGGVIDYNDKAGAGLGTKNPVIFFGGNTNFNTKSIKELDANQIATAKKSVKGIQAKAYAKLLLPSAIEVSAGIAAIESYGLYNSYKIGELQKKKEDKKKKQEERKGRKNNE